MIDPERLRPLNAESIRARAAHVLYAMRSAPRGRANHALWYAAAEADRLGLPLEVAYVDGGPPGELGRLRRWRLAGLDELEAELTDAGIGFASILEPGASVPRELVEAAAIVVVDRSPAREAIAAAARLVATAGTLAIEVDGESVIPEAVASDRREWAARTFRPKAEAALSWYAERPIPPLPAPARAAPRRPRALSAPSASPAPSSTRGDAESRDSFGPPPGSTAAREALRSFLEERLDSYDDDRDDPNLDGTSGLSPYLSRGFISPLEVIKAARAHGGPGYPAFAEQFVVRRELCRNFARYCPDGYDAWEGLPAWSRAALEAAGGDARDYVYARDDFESASTHDPYWNAAQRSLLATGTIHTYMRMYWGKTILAWSASPREAYATALYLNDRYALDGRDPNGWAGVAWCFGLHDRPWPARPVFGTVRSMTASGLRRKFDADAYAARFPPIARPVRPPEPLLAIAPDNGEAPL